MKALVVSRSALIAALAALALGSCSGDKSSADISAPQELSSLAGAAAITAGVMQICVDPASPAGNYHFTLSGATNLQAGDVVAASPLGINTNGGAGPFCANALTRTGAANSVVATIAVTASTNAGGTFSFVCADDFGGSSCNPASGVNNARAGESSFHGSTITFKFVPHVGPAAPTPPPPPPPPHAPPPHAPPPHAPPPPPPPFNPDAPPPTTDAVFVIGDMTDHDVGASVYFFGSQWSKKNLLSGGASDGIAAFKGYATNADDTCGGTWTGRVGNSASHHESPSGRITVIVTSQVTKNGPIISGNIVQILWVDHDGNYRSHGSGVVASINCGTGATTDH